MSKNKFTYPQLALCDWLFDDSAPGARFLTKWHGALDSPRQDFAFHEIIEKDEKTGLWKDRVISRTPRTGSSRDEIQAHLNFVRRFGGSLAIDHHKLLKAGVVKSRNTFMAGDVIDEFSKQFVNFSLPHNHSLIRRTEEGRQWWLNEGKALFEAEHKKREAKRKNSERTIVIGAWMTIKASLPEHMTKNLPHGLKLPIPTRKVFRPFATATVQSQTEKRIGITDVQLFADWNKLRFTTLNPREIEWPIQGREPNLFISPLNLMVDHADNYIGSKLHNLHTDEELDFSARAADHMSKIVPLLLSMHMALDQQQAGLEDMTREMIQNFTKGPGKPEP